MTDLSECSYEVRENPSIAAELEGAWFHVLSGPEGAVDIEIWRYPLEMSKMLRDQVYFEDSTLDEAGHMWRCMTLTVHHANPPEGGYIREEYPHRERCEFIGRPCWFDSAYLGAEELFKKWFRSGCDKETMVALLYEWYESHFNYEKEE